MTATTHITTAEQLLQAGDIGPCELVRGELIMMSPAGWQHGYIAARVLALLYNHVHAHALGDIHTAETGFRLARNPDTVRAPDVAFVAAKRARGVDKRGFFPGAPDLAVEVLSPSDTAGRLQEKIQDFFRAGTLLVWVVDPEKKTVTIYSPDAPMRVLSGAGTLSGGKVIPGFELVVDEIFETHKPPKRPRKK
jgi:Uma2 family endonuclease